MDYDTLKAHQRQHRDDWSKGAGIFEFTERSVG